MTSQAKPDLLQHINDFPLSDAAAEVSFTSKLADENAWTLGHAELVEQEYRKFLYLSQVAGHTVCPSGDVDKAWHLHLTQTQSYQQLCANVLGKFLHHSESKGGPQELQKHQTMYDATLLSYSRILGSKPPANIWPSSRKRFALEKDGPVETAWQLPFGLHAGMAWTAACLLIALVAALLWIRTWHVPVFPNTSGPGFLRLYLLALVAAALVVAWLRHWQTAGIADTTALDTYEAAWVCGGIRRVFATALASLVKRGVLMVSTERSWLTGARATCRRTNSAVDLDALHPVERICLDALPFATVDTATVRNIARGKILLSHHASETMRAMQRRLENAGLIYRKSHCSALMGRAVLALTLLLTVAMARLVHGMEDFRPVGFLFLLILVNTIMLALCLHHAAAATARGRKLVADLEKKHTQLKRNAGRTLPLLALGVAIFGMQSVSAEPQFDGFRRVVANPGDGGGGGCGGSGGCGGGGCGGGGCGG